MDTRSKPAAIKVRKIRSGSARAQLIADLFHMVNQPLSALACWLDLATKYDGLPRPIRNEIRQATDCIQQITWPVAAIRELMEPDEIRACEEITLGEQIEGLVEELRPVAENRGVQLTFRAMGDSRTRFPTGKSREMLFRLLESALGCAGSGDRIRVTLKGTTQVVLIITSYRKDVQTQQHREQARREQRCVFSNRLAIWKASELVEAAGGRVMTGHERSGERVVIVLPQLSEAGRKEAVRRRQEFPICGLPPQLGKICRG
ncbi:MAG TPA: hypothetical protein VFA68_01160 [Terriglobales bacterium]|nr:hypothetical protein [Terriglobales bacterium]